MVKAPPCLTCPSNQFLTLRGGLEAASVQVHTVHTVHTSTVSTKFLRWKMPALNQKGYDVLIAESPASSLEGIYY